LFEAVLFATDLAARGLDFPAVDWVIQMDCPEDVPTYIHRVGRTARYNADGKALLILLPSEEKMMEALKESRIPLKVLKTNPKHILSIQNKLAGLVSQSTELKYLAQKVCIFCC
jgi:ATP-dependent RNA helicase DDX10/DBP4